MNRHGSTLVELLVGAVIGLGVVSAMTSLLGTSVRAWRRADASAEVGEAIASGIDAITRDVRLAGYDPAGTAAAGVVAASSDSLEVTADLDGNGVVDPDSEEHVTYRCSAGCETIQRVVGRQVMPLVSSVAAFRFRYFDEHGAELTPVDAAGRAAIRRVTMRIVTRARGGVPPTEIASGARILNR